MMNVLKITVSRYTCRVATILKEYTRHHTMIVFGQIRECCIL